MPSAPAPIINMSQSNCAQSDYIEVYINYMASGASEAFCQCTQLLHKLLSRGSVSRPRSRAYIVLRFHWGFDTVIWFSRLTVIDMSIMNADDRNVVVPKRWWEILPRVIYAMLEKVETSQPWFEVYHVKPDIYVIYEPYQFEEAISYLVLGDEKAALIDTGCGIGNIRELVEELTHLPVMVVNTHAHNDHVAQNYLFDEVATYDDKISREVSQTGYGYEKMAHLISDGMTWKPLPESFDPEGYHVPPFTVTCWLKDGDIIDLGNRKLEVIYTPGHSTDSVCLLDRDARMLWTGDIFYTGGIYTYLPGGDIDEFIKSYHRIIGMFPFYDKLMPSHNEPLVKKEILERVLDAVVSIQKGTAGNYIEGFDGDVPVRRYNYNRFAIITRDE